MPIRRRSDVEFGRPRRPLPLTTGDEAWSRLVPDELALPRRFSQPVVRTTSLLTGVFTAPLPRAQPWWLYAGSAALAVTLGGTLSSSFVLGTPWLGTERTASGRRSSTTGAETAALTSPSSITPVADELPYGVDADPRGGRLHDNAPTPTSRAKRRAKAGSFAASARKDKDQSLETNVVHAPSDAAEASSLREPDMDLMDIPSSPMEEQALQARHGTSAPVPARADADEASATREQGYGTLRINSRPWAHVYVDGSSIGYTPISALQVEAGRHSVRLINANLRMSKSIVVHVAPGETLTRVEALEEQPAEPAPAAARTAPRAPEMSLL